MGFALSRKMILWSAGLIIEFVGENVRVGGVEEPEIGVFSVLVEAEPRVIVEHVLF